MLVQGLTGSSFAPMSQTSPFWSTKHLYSSHFCEGGAPCSRGAVHSRAGCRWRPRASARSAVSSNLPQGFIREHLTELHISSAKHYGAHVIGTTSTPEKAALAKAAGASEVIIYGGDVNVAEEIYKITGGVGIDRGVHAVFDGVGKGESVPSSRSVAPLELDALRHLRRGL